MSAVGARVAAAVAETSGPIRTLTLHGVDDDRRAALLTREWLVTNGLGGYASGTIGGAPSRRYHGLLIAALPPPYGRRLLLTDVSEALYLDGRRAAQLTATTADDAAHVPLEEFRLEAGLPAWRYDVGGVVIEKRMVMPHGQNTVHVLYELVAGAEFARLDVTLAAHHRPHDAAVDTPLAERPPLTRSGAGYELTIGELPPLRLMIDATHTPLEEPPAAWPERRYAVEESRGYMGRAGAWTPGVFALELKPAQPIAIVASTEPWEVITALEWRAAFAAERDRRLACVAAAVPDAQKGFAAELVLAADQFIVTPVGRSAEAARVRAEGAEERSVIAGYHWFTDWGRDTMISLEGLTLLTGRAAEAKGILRTFASAIRDGLLPNLFPEGESEGLYHTADATLWLFHALDRYLMATSDRALLQALLPQLVEIVEHHTAGTRFGIGVDRNDGLLRQGAPGFQLTWMDAKVGDWVVTPRRGKAVEINALWYNALCLLADWHRSVGRGGDGARFDSAAAQVRDSFNRRFWHDPVGHLFDVVDGENGDDAACRPNQVIAISLAHPVLARRHWQRVLRVVREELLTPYGLRTLSPKHPAYQPKYYGDLRSRDAAYHQGTVWPWLLGPFIDAWRRAFPEDTAAPGQFLAAFEQHLDDGCVGSISEIFDAEAPYVPRGCVAQAWSVAEILRCVVYANRH
ncbi:MAG TPA: amylo-alpha-1,6-glucosidase [Gammaproteobacteria bacterium]|nr:amylo-alpha-1,6-glucosidase [Gammaproteobacteria bacterium]